MKKKTIYTNLTEQEISKVETYAEKLTTERITEDLEKKIPPSRRRRPVSLSTAARKLIQKGLEKLEEEIKND